jgi:hypothetical protein
MRRIYSARHGRGTNADAFRSWTPRRERYRYLLYLDTPEHRVIMGIVGKQYFIGGTVSSSGWRRRGGGIGRRWISIEKDDGSLGLL